MDFLPDESAFYMAKALGASPWLRRSGVDTDALQIMGFMGKNPQAVMQTAQPGFQATELENTLDEQQRKSQLEYLQQMFGHKTRLQGEQGRDQAMRDVAGISGGATVQAAGLKAAGEGAKRATEMERFMKTYGLHEKQLEQTALDREENRKLREAMSGEKLHGWEKVVSDPKIPKNPQFYAAYGRKNYPDSPEVKSLYDSVRSQPWITDENHAWDVFGKVANDLYKDGNKKPILDLINKHNPNKPPVANWTQTPQGTAQTPEVNPWLQYMNMP